MRWPRVVLHDNMGWPRLLVTIAWLLVLIGAAKLYKNVLWTYIVVRGALR